MSDEKQPSVTFVSAGMELRDWFAGQVMIGLVTTHPPEIDALVSAAYEIADAMLAERKKK